MEQLTMQQLREKILEYNAVPSGRRKSDLIA